MKFQAKYQGKWIAAKNDKVIADASTLEKLIKKVQQKEDVSKLKFSLVPKGYMAGLNMMQ